MPEILSQNQIDELLEELMNAPEKKVEATESNEIKKVKEYDFKSPKKFSKEQLKLLNGIYDNFSRHLASYFSGILRTYCEITIEEIEEHPYYEYNNALPDSVLIGVIDAKTDEGVTPSMEGTMLVDISNSITFALIERLLGGSGNGLTMEREFTEIEISLMEKIFKQIVYFTKESWLNIVDIKPEMKRIETNSRLMQTMSMDEIVVIIIMNVTIKSVKGTLSVCIPCISLESVLNKSQNFSYNRKKQEIIQDTSTKEALLEHIKDSPLDIKALFGGTTLTLNDIVNLQVGDVIKLDQKIDSEVKVNIGDKTWFTGIPGMKKNRKVIKVDKVL